MDKGIGGHHRAFQGRTDEWLTPPSILDALGSFDLDPCASTVRPWPIAKRHYTVDDDGLTMIWPRGWSVFMNPPYGPETGSWLRALADHSAVEGGDGIALVFARTETEMFVEQVWDRASAVLFLYGRLFFHYVNGVAAEHNSGAPSVLVAYGDAGAVRLKRASETLRGRYIALNP